MPRLKFEPEPVDRRDGSQTQESHDTWVREYFATHWPDQTPTACDCGFYSDGWLVTCRPQDRRRCHSNVTQRLTANARNEHLRGLRAKREFPGPPHDGKGAGWCRWCGSEVLNEKTGRRHAQRTWCVDRARCLRTYFLHTDHNAQRRFLRERDGDGCKLCLAPWTEVDHVIPLGAVWEAFPDPARRRWFFGPRNLQLLCVGGGCHNLKTREDVAFIKACQANGEAWAKAEVLRRLDAAGRLRIVERVA